MEKVLKSLLALLVFVGISLPSFILAADYPTKPIIFVTPFPAGGNADQCARFLSPTVERELGENLVVNPQPGAAMMTAFNKVFRSKGDGYTLLFAPQVGFTITAHRSTVRFKYQDFTPVCGVYLPNMVLATKKGRFMDLNDMVAQAKKNPGKLNVATIGRTSPHAILVKQLQKIFGISLQMVPFQDGPSTVAAVLGGHADLLVTDNYNDALFPLLCTSEERAPRYPQAPTLKELGYDNTAMTLIYVIVGPKGMPAEVVAKLSAAFKKAVEDPEVKARAAKLNWEAKYMDAKAITKVINQDYAVIGEMIKSGELVLE